MVVLGLAACGASETTPAIGALAPVPADEQAQMIEAMRPPMRARPVIAVVAQNDGTETTDFLIPYAVLKQSGAADVLAVAPEDRAIRLTPALAVNPESTLAAFDARYPEGADYVVVPKIEDAANPAVVAWIQAQAGKGSTIVGICSGVKTVAAAGLVDGRDATGHWFDIDGLREAHPTMRWVRDRRYVVDRGVMTTTGVSASLPASLALVEAFAGRDRAAEVAAELGVTSWDARHDSSAFSLSPELKQTAERNRALGADPDLWLVPVAPGVDEIALGFTADAWSRTMRSKALAVAGQPGPITMRRGLVLVPDATTETAPAGSDLALVTGAPATALPVSLEGIADRYDTGTASFVALQLEYAWDRD
jgi:putative intracellular protease/amidase